MIIRKDNYNNYNRNDNMGNSSQGNTYLALFTRPRSHSILFIQKFVFGTFVREKLSRKKSTEILIL